LIHQSNKFRPTYKK